MIKTSQIGNEAQLLAQPPFIKAVTSNSRDHSVLTLAVIESAMLGYTKGTLFYTFSLLS